MEARENITIRTVRYQLQYRPGTLQASFLLTDCAAANYKNLAAARFTCFF